MLHHNICTYNLQMKYDWLYLRKITSVGQKKIIKKKIFMCIILYSKTPQKKIYPGSGIILSVGAAI